MRGFPGRRRIEALVSPISVGVICGLVLGKPIGITSASPGSPFDPAGALPEQRDLASGVGVGMLGGIGFTMSLFIAISPLANAAELKQRRSVSWRQRRAGSPGDDVFKRIRPNE